MDNDIKRQVNKALESIRKISPENIDIDNLDPVVRMLLVALLNEGEKIHDEIADIPRKVAERYCTDFIPYDKVGAIPAITVVNPEFKSTSFKETIGIDTGASFQYKKKDSKFQLNYLPLFKTMLLPHSNLFMLSGTMLKDKDGTIPIHSDNTDRLWVGLETTAEIDSLRGLSIMVKGTDGILPDHVYVVSENRDSDIRELEISSMNDMENIGLIEPFDAQQTSNVFLSVIDKWKDSLQNLDNSAILYITDESKDRDLLKRHAFPRSFQQWLEDDMLDRFSPDILWLRLDFPTGYVVPETVEILINAVPVANVDVNSVMLTQGNPIAKLHKGDDSFFLQVMETNTSSHRQGFDMNSDMVTVRDFEASRYDNATLYRDVRTLYNRFLDDYYAFTEYNGLKDGELLGKLRETVNKLGKSVGEVNDKYRFDNGTYVMRHINQVNQNNSIRVSYMTTMGERGNMPLAGQEMEIRRVPGINQKVPVLTDATAGTDKAPVDARYELLRYFTLTNDRLYTKIDIEAFLRKEIMLAFGREEFHRIFIKIHIEGAGGEKKLCRGLYIDIEFKDKKNFLEAERRNFGMMMKRRISALSCISMPIMITLKNLEE